MLAKTGSLESNTLFGIKDVHDGLSGAVGRHHRALDLDHFDVISNRRRSLRKGLNTNPSDRMDNFLHGYARPSTYRRKDEVEFYGSAPGSGGYSTYFYESVPVAASKKTGVADVANVEPQTSGLVKFLENIFNVNFWISMFNSPEDNEVLEREDEVDEAVEGEFIFF
jgi:hypothetical protein